MIFGDTPHFNLVNRDSHNPKIKIERINLILEISKQLLVELGRIKSII
jgi:hypothetical protein